MEIRISDVHIASRRRPIKDIKGLADSIRRIGLLNPITVTEDTRLIAGYHRLEACKMLGWVDIPAIVVLLSGLEAELAEIDENLVRNELTTLERGEQLARRKEIYEALQPESKKGGDRGNQYVGGRERQTEIISFSQDVATKTGVSERTVQQEVQIASKIADEVRDTIRETPLADNKTELLRLSRMDKGEQQKVVEKITSGESKSVKEAERAVKREERVAISDAVEQSTVVETVKVEAGQWWRLGKHMLFCGDTGTPEFYENVPPSTFAFADPPYNADVAEWDCNFIWNHDWLKDKASIVAVTPGIEGLFNFAQVTKMPYKWSLACWIDNGMTRGAMGFGNWIYVALFAVGSIHRQAQDFIRVSIKTAENDETRHKGRKPSELLVRLLDTFTQLGGSVIDPFLGSGTTLLVAEAAGRVCYGGELSPEYCRDIIGRWESMTGDKAVLA